MTDAYQQAPTRRCLSSMKKSGKLAIGLVGLSLGVLLLLLGRGGGHAASEPSPTLPEAMTARSAETYRAELEARIEALCARVVGVGEVRAVVTLSGGYEYVYAMDTRGGVGGQTTTYVTIGRGSEESLVYVTEKPPCILGIGVVCTGGMDPLVRQELLGLLSATFGIGSNKIYVTGGK